MAWAGGGTTIEPVQSTESLNEFWSESDPWHYDDTVDDEMRVARLLSALPEGRYGRTLDIGCGNGFLTAHLPGAEVVGVDVSPRALGWARDRVAARPDRDRFTFRDASLFDVHARAFGTFDLIVITGVLYPQYIGKAFSLVPRLLSGLARPQAICVSVHIEQWFAHRLPFTSLSISVDSYKDYLHRLEVFQVSS